MASAHMHQARFAPISDDALLRAKNDFIEGRIEKMLKENLFDLFLGTDIYAVEMLHKLKDGQMLDLIELQDRFNLRMRHEARYFAEREWDQTEATRAIFAIQDSVGDHRD